ncbi:hypothetical protein I7I51_00100 [Histoplasma capsulatum]|uniref:Uncharacterized protein n=1 Tax=Ajellomyces capsulatus TaxID=5037 RepID=A0A8A1MEB7_AJECA|nr:predicted protein [Histoplasma mississippiense (nom. inval.)]EDN08485.1 predicted protein [Histoplasma mississippiense (nom. inval.)]QSS63043.1 hypothetical protein I7I51_00100 [Histoplasma capsulatum]
MTTLDSEFPYSLTISLPLPTHRLASAALRTLQVDAELSPLVHRSFRLTRPPPQPPSPSPYPATPSADTSAIDTATTTATTTATATATATAGTSGGTEARDGDDDEEELTVLQTEYRATTNRMLRIAVNGFMESLGVVLGVMEELDVDVLEGELGGIYNGY